jgi:hypothetical protein
MVETGGFAMDDPQTCGQGLAWNAALPARLGDVAGGLAAVLEAHLEALDLSDEAARPEHTVYVGLAQDCREVAARLGQAAARMSGAHDVPMGRHDAEAMASPEAARAFTRFVEAEEALLAYLQERLPEDREMQRQMAG